MFLSSDTVDGDASGPTAAHDRMHRGFPPDTFARQVSPGFRDAIAAGLPRRRVEPLGEVRSRAVGQETGR